MAHIIINGYELVILEMWLQDDKSCAVNILEYSYLHIKDSQRGKGDEVALLIGSVGLAW